MCLYFIKEYQTSSEKNNVLEVLICYCTIIKNRKKERMDTFFNSMFDVKGKKKKLFSLELIDLLRWSSQHMTMLLEGYQKAIYLSDLRVDCCSTVHEHYHKLIYSYWQKLHLDSKWWNRWFSRGHRTKSQNTHHGRHSENILTDIHVQGFSQWNYLLRIICQSEEELLHLKGNL